MSSARWKIDRRSLVLAEVRKAAALGLDDGAEHLLEESNRTAPIEEGTLIGSGTTSLDKAQLKAAVAYDTPYAVRQHEDTRLRHDEGRRAKWLEATLKERANPIRDHIAAKITEALK